MLEREGRLGARSAFRLCSSASDEVRQTMKRSHCNLQVQRSSTRDGQLDAPQERGSSLLKKGGADSSFVSWSLTTRISFAEKLLNPDLVRYISFEWPGLQADPLCSPTDSLHRLLLAGPRHLPALTLVVRRLSPFKLPYNLQCRAKPSSRETRSS